MSIYLDYNATTPIDPEVVAAMQPLLSGFYGNPSSSHSFGFEAKKLLEESRLKVAGFLNCKPEEIVFTSGGSESNNHAIKGVAWAHRQGKRHIITSSVEHPASLEACRYLEAEGCRVTYLPVDGGGRISMGDLDKAIEDDTILITIMHANNETGTIQPIPDISELARQKKIAFHTDAAQSAGKIPVNVRELGVDLMSVAGHKLYGPKGIGALYIREGVLLGKLIHGAEHESNRRAGTENILLIAGLGKACEIAGRDLVKNSKKMAETRDYLLSLLRKSIPGILLNGDPEHCLPNTLNVSFPGIEADLLLSGIPEIAASAGAACHSEGTEISHVLEAMGLEPGRAISAIRFSTGKNSSNSEIEKAAGHITTTVISMASEEETSPGPAPDKVKLTRFTSGLGCACKLNPQDLEKVLGKLPVPKDDSILVGTENPDDATVWSLGPDKALVQSVDFFTPVVDDPYSFGQIAAANALSDLYAMGATPLFALNIVAFPSKRLPMEVLHQILEGARAKAGEAGMHILGGHTIEDSELKYGMVVNGHVHPDRILKKSGAKPGDVLVLTKPLGTGILSTALKRDMLNPEWEPGLLNTMKQLNAAAASLFEKYTIHAATDITGFGLLGHLIEMCGAGKVSAEISTATLPVLPGVRDSIRSGMIPGGSLRNLEYAERYTSWPAELSREYKIILSDAQTSGGLLLAMPEDDAGGYVKKLLTSDGIPPVIIGKILKAGKHTVYIR